VQSFEHELAKWLWTTRLLPRFVRHSGSTGQYTSNILIGFGMRLLAILVIRMLRDYPS